MKNKRVRIIISAVIVLSAAVIGTVLFLRSNVQHSSESFRGESPLVNTATLATFPKKAASSANLTRIADDLIPPTNSWISGAVLQTTPKAVYPMPLSFLAKDRGFEIGLPPVQASSTVISGSHAPGIIATLSSATNFSLTRYDKVSATLTYRNKTTSLGALTVAEGSPFVFYKALAASMLTLTNTQPLVGTPSSTYVRYTVSGHTYAVATYEGATLSRTEGTTTVNVPAGGLVTFYALPSETADPLHEFAGNELTDVRTTSKVEDSHSVTIFNYHTINNKPTVFVPMSYSETSSQSVTLLQYASIYGPMRAISGREFSLSAPLLSPSDELDLSHLSDNEKQQLITSLRSDIASTSIAAKDSYFAGKGLARAANLLKLAKSLGETDMSAQLIKILGDAFASRLYPDYFYYDTGLHGIAATTAAFGSEDFNDHHFHYGYFLYAASILATYDKSFLEKYRDQVNLLAADIASYASSKDFPLQRNYDAYAQHGWAAGLAPFADGNNQESSSEAINAWNAVALWGQVTGNSALEDSGIWMLSNESATAMRAWRAPTSTLQASYLKAFKSPVSSLNFGGKRTYGTFFSDEPSAKLGIQLIPMSPVMREFSGDGGNITAAVRASITGNNFNTPLGDYVLMYLALSEPNRARGLLGTQTTIDDGNSKSYMEAWVFSREK